MNSLKDVCRFCMDGNQLSNIYKTERGIRLDTKVMECSLTQIQQDDGLPSLICHSCEEKVNSFYNFKIECQNTEHKLRILLNHKLAMIKNVKIESEICIVEENLEIKDELYIEAIKSENETSDVHPKVVVREVKCDFLTEQMQQPDLKKRIKSHNLRKYNAKKTCKLKKNVNENVDSTNNFKMNIKKESFLDTLTSNSNDYCIFETMKNEKYSVESSQNPMRPYQCELCGRTFKLKSVLKKHILTHSDKKLFGCPLCSKRYTRSEHLVVHMRFHTGIRPFICEICARSFSKNQDLSRHKRIHSDDRNFPCPRCQRKFKRSADIHTHMRSHTGVRPFVCGNCAKTYTSRSGLTKHNRTHCNL